jgi:DNA-binding MurR/RpiR family transcriptional regulator
LNQWPLTARLVGEFDSMSAQLKRAGRFIIDRPRDVALLSMREQARQAGVQGPTMTRLAQHLGFNGYEAIRELYAEAIRSGTADFSTRADRQVASQKLIGDQALAAELAGNLSGHIARLGEPDALERFAAAAETLASARRIYCLGMRSSFPVAWHFHYLLSLVRDGVILFDGTGGLGIDRLHNCASDDILLVASVHPYTRTTVEAVRYAAERGIRVVAITDSPVSPLASDAKHLILVETATPSFMHAMVSAFAAAEILATLVAGRGGQNALAALRKTEQQFAALNVHLESRSPRNPK